MRLTFSIRAISTAVIAPCVLALFALRASATEPNVTFTVGGTIIATCPGGDSVVTGLPSRLRMLLQYKNSSGAAKVKVPPESIWVLVQPVASQSLSVHVWDERPWSSDKVQVFAEDSTDANGYTRIVVPSISGYGSLNLEFFVSGDSKGTASVTLLSVDPNASGYTDATDAGISVDINNDGLANGTDTNYINDHKDHGHRNALHGGLARRTNTCGTCVGDDMALRYLRRNALGGSPMAWSTDDRYLAYTEFRGDSADCRVMRVPSDPANGNDTVQVTQPPLGVHDYDPSWSPLGGVVTWDRGDSAIFALSTQSGAITLVTHADIGDHHDGDVNPAFSPDGQWLAFARLGNGTPFQIWKIPSAGILSGATATQLTNANSDNGFPQWSPDGKMIIFERAVNASHRYTYIMSADTVNSERALVLPSSGLSVTPQFSPDAQMVFTGAGPGNDPATSVIQARTMYGNIGGQTDLKKLVKNYDTYTQSPQAPNIADAVVAVVPTRWSSDGTRVAIAASPPEAHSELPQVYAARRNMNRPPTIVSLQSITFADSLPVVDFLGAHAGTAMGITVSATDAESDALTYKAYFLKSGMSFDAASTHILTWTPTSAQLGAANFVRFQVETPSGGTDYALARICGWRDSVTSLGSNGVADNEVDLYWTAPGQGKGVQYDLRYYNVAIDESNFQSATPVSAMVAPAEPGSSEVKAVVSLSACQPYYFALKTKGPCGVWSRVSNSVYVATLCGGGEGEGTRARRPGARPATLGSSGGSVMAAEMQSGSNGSLVWSVYPLDSAAVAGGDVDSLGIYEQSRDESGNWITGPHLVPSLQSTRLGIRALRSTGRLVLVGPYALNEVWSTVSMDPQSGTAVRLNHAQHSRLGDVTSSVQQGSTDGLQLAGRDTLTLTYEPSDSSASATQDYFLLIGKPGSGGTRLRPGPGLPVHRSPTFALGQNRPNPFSRSTAIGFTLPAAVQSRMQIFDMQGRLIRTLFSRRLAAGAHTVEWDQRDRSGAAVRAGVYLYRLEAGPYRAERKMILLP